MWVIRLNIMVENLIQTLFYTNTRIIIPNFGAFLPNGFDEYGNCKFIFSPNLKFNDGFLIRQLVEGRNVSYADAQVQIEHFVNNVQNELHSKRVALLAGFGGFFYDNKNVLHFLFEKDIVTANDKIRHIIEKESRGELMDIRLDEFVLSCNKTASDPSPMIYNASSPIDSSKTTVENIEIPNQSHTAEIVKTQSVNDISLQNDFFHLNTPPSDTHSFEVEEQLRKVKEVELLQKKLEELEKAKSTYLEKIKKEEEERLALLTQQKKEEERLFVLEQEKKEKERLALLAQQKKEEIIVEKRVEKPSSSSDIKATWNAKEKSVTTPIETPTPIETQQIENTISQSQEVPKSWLKVKPTTNNNVEQIFAYRGRANRKRRDMLPIILITLLLLVIFSTAGFLYFKEEITERFFTNKTHKSSPNTSDVLDLSTTSMKTYHVVVKSFTKKTDAQRYLQALKKKNPNINPQIIPQPGNLYLVSIYNYRNERDADAAIAKLRQTIPEVKKIVQN